MSIHASQAPTAVVMVRPHAFHPNPETALDNRFQASAAGHNAAQIAAAARDEVSVAAATLAAAGITVHLFDDQGQRDTPDSVFPNNWFSTHSGGHIALYPMYSPNRRRERRSDVIELLKTRYRVQDVIDYSGLEADGLFLEGTGAMVLDHIDRVAYTARSNRASEVMLERFCTHFNYEPMVFSTAGTDGHPTYHTNVMMCIATRFAMVCFDLFTDRARGQEVRQRLEESGRTVIALRNDQIASFAGNAIELTRQGPHHDGRRGRLLALSTTAAASLSDEQRATITSFAELLPLSVPTIEMAGGSVRCMLAGVHLAKRPDQTAPAKSENTALV